MNNTQFINDFGFVRYQKNKSYRYTGYAKNNGAPAHYIVRLVKGSVKIKSQAKTISIAQGEIFYIPKGLKYQSFWRVNMENQLIFDAYGFQYFPKRDDYNYTLQKITCTPEAQKRLVHIAESMSVDCTTVGELYLFLGEVLHQMEYEAKSSYDLAEIAVGYMRNNIQFRIADVAKHCDVSESTLYTVFKRTYHKTPVEMKQMILCERASELLTATNLSVEEISGRLCFSSSSYFRKIFRKCTGKTPLQVRKDARFQL